MQEHLNACILFIILLRKVAAQIKPGSPTIYAHGKIATIVLSHKRNWCCEFVGAYALIIIYIEYSFCQILSSSSKKSIQHPSRSSPPVLKSAALFSMHLLKVHQNLTQRSAGSYLSACSRRMADSSEKAKQRGRSIRAGIAIF